jgi:YkoY family integral membrane protein
MEFFGQSLQAGDLFSVLFLVLLEGALSADNALVLAIMVRHLPKADQKKALLYGLGGAFVFRLLAILLASYMLRLWWLQAFGAIYLLAVPIKHFLKPDDPTKPKGRTKGGLWQTVIAVELTDIAFAIDSVLAGVGFVNNRQEKIWVVYFGALIGIVLLRFAAGMIIRLLDKYPFLDKVAYALVLWVGVKLAWLALGNFADVYFPKTHIGEMPQWLFWSVLGVIGIGGTLLALRAPGDGELDADQVAAGRLFQDEEAPQE